MPELQGVVPDNGGSRLPEFVDGLEIKCVRCGSEDFAARVSGADRRVSVLKCEGCGDAAEFDRQLRPDSVSEGLHADIHARVAQEEARGAVVYFIGADEGPVKIGTTTSPMDARLRVLQTGHPHKIRVLAWTLGGYELESALHTIFAGSRLYGEWFERTPALCRLMRAWAQK